MSLLFLPYTWLKRVCLKYLVSLLYFQKFYGFFVKNDFPKLFLPFQNYEVLS